MAPSRKHDKSFVCTECGKKLSGDRARHTKLHSSDREALKWSCAVCGFGDLQKHNVVQHYIRTHTADRPYECDQKVVDLHGRTGVCSFRCQSSSVLTRHKRDVHGYNPKEEKRVETARSRKLQFYDQFVVPPPRSTYDSASSSTLRARPSTSSSSTVPGHCLAPSLADTSSLLSFPIPASFGVSEHDLFDPAVSFQEVFDQQLSASMYSMPPAKSEPLDMRLGGSYMPVDFGLWAPPRQYPAAPQQVPVPQHHQPWGSYQVPPHFGHSASHW